jgi:hypothetical protein
MREQQMGDPEAFEEWEARLFAWLASLPADDPRTRIDEIDQCVEFAKAENPAKP